MDNNGALAGIKVLDMGRVLAAPFCAAILADMGASVIKIEAPGVGDDARYNLPIGGYFENFNRGKQGITLDLKKGKEIFLKLVQDADILVENFRPGVMDKLGLGYETLKQVNPRLIYAAVSGFGQNGPYSQKAGYDPLAQAMCGIMSVTGFEGDRPVRCGASVCDILGGINAAVGVLAALHYRNITGKGQMIDVALVDVGVVALSSVTQVYLSEGKIPQAMGNGYVAGSPGGCYEAADGDFMLVGSSDKNWEKICNSIGHPEYITASEFCNKNVRNKNRKLVDSVINEWTRTRTVDELVKHFSELKMACGPVLNVEQVVNDPHIGGAREMFTTIDHPELGQVKITNQGIKMSETPPRVRSSSPLLGQHNIEVLTALGYSQNEIDSFKEQGFI
jgi:formyl-CoA transferase